MIEVSAEEIGEPLASRIVYNKEQELTGSDTETEQVLLPPVVSSASVFIIAPKQNDNSSGSAFAPHDLWLSKLVVWTGLERPQWDFAALPHYRTDAEDSFQFFLKEIYPRLKESPPKVILTFGMEAAYPFFKGEVTKKVNWFDSIHSRLHQKKFPGNSKSVLVYCMPSLEVCSNPELKDTIGLVIKTFKGILLEQKIVIPKV